MAQAKHIKPALAIVKLDNIPGPEADADALNEHYKRVQSVFACRRYDDVVTACHWCCDSENDLVFSKPDKARGTRMFCSTHCANSFGAYEVKVWGGAAKPLTEGKAQPTESAKVDEPPSNPKRRRSKRDPIVQSDETVATEEEQAQEPPDWKPVGKRPRKPRKERAVRPKRTDGLCPKGLHKMDEANTYTYKDKTWCRECRKSSRAASAAKRNGA